jgi:hypothetical protein
MVGKPTDHDPRRKMIQRVEKKHRVELDKLDPKARLKARLSGRGRPPFKRRTQPHPTGSVPKKSPADFAKAGLPLNCLPGGYGSLRGRFGRFNTRNAGLVPTGRGRCQPDPWCCQCPRNCRLVSRAPIGVKAAKSIGDPCGHYSFVIPDIFNRALGQCSYEAGCY